MKLEQYDFTSYANQELQDLALDISKQIEVFQSFVPQRRIDKKTILANQDMLRQITAEQSKRSQV